MSILVECITLVAPRAVVDERYPGGADALIVRCYAADHPARYAIADEEFVAISFYAPEHARAEVEHLEAHGLVYVNEEECQDICIIDQEDGCLVPCFWLDWDVDEHQGFTHAWRMDSHPGGEITVWAGWTPEQSQSLGKMELRADPSRMVRLSRDPGGLESWLDLATGHVVEMRCTEE